MILPHRSPRIARRTMRILRLRAPAAAVSSRIATDSPIVRNPICTSIHCSRKVWKINNEKFKYFTTLRGPLDGSPATTVCFRVGPLQGVSPIFPAGGIVGRIRYAVTPGATVGAKESSPPRNSAGGCAKLRLFSGAFPQIRSFSRASMSAVIRSRSYFGSKPHSSRAAEQSRLSGHESAIACRIGSTS